MILHNSASTWTTWSSYEPTWSGTSSITSTWSVWSSTTASSIDSDSTYSAWLSKETYSYEVYTQSKREREEENRKIKDLKRKKDEAEETAKMLLLDLIGKEELEVYRETGRVFVKGTKFDYIIQKEGFVKKIEKDRITDLCIHLKDRYQYPDTDNVIALKLLIEGNEDEFLKTANIHGSRPLGSLSRAACMN